jgi:hypothetical protein
VSSEGEPPLKESDEMSTVFSLAEKCAVERYDGHLMLLRFTTGWKACFGTVDLHFGEGAKQVQELPSFTTADEALEHAISADVHKRIA